MTTMALCRLNNRDRRKEEESYAAARTAGMEVLFDNLCSWQAPFYIPKKQKEKKRLCKKMGGL